MPLRQRRGEKQQVTEPREDPHDDKKSKQSSQTIAIGALLLFVLCIIAFRIATINTGPSNHKADLVMPAENLEELAKLNTERFTIEAWSNFQNAACMHEISNKTFAKSELISEINKSKFFMKNKIKEGSTVPFLEFSMVSEKDFEEAVSDWLRRRGKLFIKPIRATESNGIMSLNGTHARFYIHKNWKTIEFDTVENLMKEFRESYFPQIHNKESGFMFEEVLDYDGDSAPEIKTVIVCGQLFGVTYRFKSTEGSTKRVNLWRWDSNEFFHDEIYDATAHTKVGAYVKSLQKVLKASFARMDFFRITIHEYMINEVQFQGVLGSYTVPVQFKDKVSARIFDCWIGRYSGRNLRKTARKIGWSKADTESLAQLGVPAIHFVEMGHLLMYNEARKKNNLLDIIELVGKYLPVKCDSGCWTAFKTQEDYDKAKYQYENLHKNEISSDLLHAVFWGSRQWKSAHKEKSLISF